MASVGCVLSWLAGSQMKNLISIQIILGFLHSYFMNSFFFCSNVVYQSWMDKKRVFGNATVFCGIPLGAMILSPLWAFLNESFSWRGTCLIQAGLSGRILQLLRVINYESNGKKQLKIIISPIDMALFADNRMPRKPSRKRKISICLGFAEVTKSLAFCYIMCFILRFLCSFITSNTFH